MIDFTFEMFLSLFLGKICHVPLTYSMFQHDLDGVIKFPRLIVFQLPSDQKEVRNILPHWQLT